jgi:UDP-N-acetylglucosamine 3-dehydrogenase
MEAVEMTAKRVRYGIIGCCMGMAHAEGVRLCRNSELKAICDIKDDILGSAREKLGLSDKDCYNDYKEMIKRTDVDAVIIAVPDQLHPEMTIAALKSGKHVLCEKPMAMTTGECRAMIKASRDTGKKLMIGQICRYAPGFVAAKKIIESGGIGELFFVESEYAHDYKYSPGIDNWRIDTVRLRYPALGGGCHAVDLLRWIAGDPYEVVAFENHKVLTEWPVNDFTIGIMKFPNDVLGKVMVSVGCKRDYTMRSVFYGSKGTIIADNTSNYIKVFKECICEGGSLFKDIRDQTVGLQYPVDARSHNTAGEIEEFSDAILNDMPVRTDGVEGAKTVSVCLALVESAAMDGKKIAPDYSF